eukprot:13824638-Ditylum_brightwellii.AAC.1
MDKECEPKKTKESSAASENYSKRGGSAKSNAKLAKRFTVIGTKNPHYVTPMSEDVTIASTMSIATAPQKSVGSPSTSAKDTLAMKGRADLMTAIINKDLCIIINEKIAVVLSCKEKKELSKFEALSILSNSNKYKDSNSDSRVGNTSNEDMDLE